MRHVALGVADMGAKEIEYVTDALRANRLSVGPRTQRFEEGFAAAHECRHAVMCNSGTSALQLALLALKELHRWADGDEVIVPALTFIATSNIVLYAGMVPRFVDVDPYLYNIEPDLIEAAITPRTRAIIPVHLFGLPCDMDRILEIAARHGLEVIEDSCETMFVRYRGRSVGSFGALACFSTYVAHLLVTGVGGLITTNSEELASMCRSLLGHGRDQIYLNIDDDDDVSDNVRREIIARRFSFVRLGYSYRVTELEGAIGLAQLERRDEILPPRREYARKLTQALSEFSEELQLPRVPDDREHAFMLYPIVVRNGGTRGALLEHLEGQGIETRHMFPLLTQPVYQRLFPGLAEQYPVALRLSRDGFYIGCHHRLGDDDVAWVADAFRGWFQSR